jgi:hypothetical protein
MELTMDVTTDSHWCLHGLHIALLDQNLLNLFAQDSQFSLWQNCTVFDGLKPIINDVLTHFSLNFKIFIQMIKFYSLLLKYKKF